MGVFQHNSNDFSMTMISCKHQRCVTADSFPAVLIQRFTATKAPVKNSQCFELNDWCQWISRSSFGELVKKQKTEHFIGFALFSNFHTLSAYEARERNRRAELASVGLILVVRQAFTFEMSAGDMKCTVSCEGVLEG